MKPAARAGAALLALVTAGVALVALGVPVRLATMSSTTHTSASSGDSGRTSVDSQLRGVRRSTRAFHDVSRAELAGYSLLRDKTGLTCIAMPPTPGMHSAGAMGVHYVRGDLVGDGRVQARRPEAMVYAPDRRGTLRLAAVEYVVLAADWHHRHAGVPKLFGRTFAFTAAGNRYGLPDFYSLHAWVWKHNPAGRFAMWNPRVHCRGAQASDSVRSPAHAV